MYKMGTISNEYIPFFSSGPLKSFLIPWRFISFMKNEFLLLWPKGILPNSVKTGTRKQDIFFLFGQIFAIFCKVTQSLGASSTVKNNQIWQTFWGKNEEMSFLVVGDRKLVSGTYYATKPKSLQNRGHRRCITK